MEAIFTQNLFELRDLNTIVKVEIIVSNKGYSSVSVTARE